MSAPRPRWQVSDERLTEIIRGPAYEAGAMATELRDLRAAAVADKALVQDVVRKAVLALLWQTGDWPVPGREYYATAIADRAAEQLASPSVLDVDLVRSVVREACQRFAPLRTDDIDCIVERVAAGLCKERP